MEWSKSRPAEWVSVARYSTDRDYGGPEEGGWYYDTGEVQPETLKNFVLPDEWPQAQLYLEQLQASCRHGERAIYHCEAMVFEYPSTRPTYC